MRLYLVVILSHCTDTASHEAAVMTDMIEAVQTSRMNVDPGSNDNHEGGRLLIDDLK